MRFDRKVAVDLAIAGSLGAAAQLLAWAGADLGVHRPVHGPRPLVPLLFLLVGFPLVFRRKHPLWVAVALFAAIAIQAVVSQYSAEGTALVLALFVTMYSLGAYADRGASVVGLCLMVATLTVQLLLDPETRTPAERWSAAFWMLLPFLAWASGLAVRGRRESRRLAEVAAAAEQARATALADERARIARELHDVIAHHQSVVVLQSIAAQGLLDVDAERARIPLKEIENNGRASMTELRRMLEVIRADDAVPFEPQPDGAAVEDLVAGARRAGLPVTLSVEGAAPTHSPSLSLTVYRIIQEALTNALKHAGSAPTRVTITYRPGCADIEVVDDGPGTSAGTGAGGHGLIGMRERVALFGGRFEAGPGDDHGFRVVASLPFPDTA